MSFANLNKLAKKLGTDPELASRLWQTGNFDAMTLATLVADPDSFTSRELDAWVRAIDCYPVADYFVSRLVMRTRIGSHRLLERLSGEQLPRIC